MYKRQSPTCHERGPALTEPHTGGVQLGDAPNRVDLMTAIDGVSFEEAWRTRDAGMFGAVPVSYLGRDAFLTNKRAAGRPQDLADIDTLT